MHRKEYLQLRTVMWAIVMGALTACGGGGESGGSSSGSPLSPAPPSGPPSTSQRTQAATATAQNNAACTAIQPFYWEIGDASVRLASGSLGSSPPVSSSSMLIASASKWIYGAYVVQLRNGNPSDADVTALTMRSAYVHFKYGACIKLNQTQQDAETVNECFTAAHLPDDGFTNSSAELGNVGKFFYNGGHFQQHAVFTAGLGGFNNAQLRTSIANQLGLSVAFTYDSPQLAAGVATTADEYAFFLRKILSNQLVIRSLLGANAVCTNPVTCATAVSTPIPSSESWHYSLGHWVEDDSVVGDGAFSSPGAFGFYPWIDKDKTFYGIIARYTPPNGIGDSVATDSVNCGRLVRKAWLTGNQQ